MIKCGVGKASVHLREIEGRTGAGWGNPTPNPRRIPDSNNPVVPIGKPATAPFPPSPAPRYPPPMAHARNLLEQPLAPTVRIEERVRYGS